MKFNNGRWLLQEKVGCFSPARVYEYHFDGETLHMTCLTRHVHARGDIVGGVVVTMEITAPYPDVLRIRAWHHEGLVDQGPSFELAEMQQGLLQLEDMQDRFIIRNGILRMEFVKESGEMTFWRGDEKLTGCVHQDLAYMKTDWTGDYYDRGPEDAWMRQQLNIDVNEKVYGLGEHFGPLVKNGQQIDIWNEDGGTSTQQAYKNIPFYMTNKGYGVFVNHPEKVSFEVGSEMVEKVSFAVQGESLDYFFIAGEDMKGVLRRYTDITGKPGLPAPWTFGLWLSTSFTTNYDEETVNGFVDGMLERGIPLSVFHFDCYWMRGHHWCDFLWDPDTFPDPEGMLKRLKAKGLKICVWINSYIGQASSMFKEGKEKGYFIKRPNGAVWQWDMWQPGMALVDFTNPEACEWFAGKLERLLDMGVDCFKTDFGERIPTDCVYYDGSDPQKMHNYYTYLYNKTVYDLLVRKRGKEEAVLFARSATAGGQKFPVHWGGDCWSTYVAMEESLRGGLSLTGSGFGFWSHDIGGFEKTSTADVYKRWCAFGLLSSHSRLHGSESYRVPWNYDEEAVDVLRRFVHLKHSLMPYLYRNAVETSRTGIPVMRMMPLEYPDDRSCAYLEDQYMLGDSLLVAPVFNDKSVAEYYLPDGKWTNFFTGEVREGGRWYKEQCDYMSIPLYVKPGSIVAVGAHQDTVVYDYAQDAEFRVYALAEGQTAESCIYGPDTVQDAKLRVTREAAGYTIGYEGKPCTVTLMDECGEKRVGLNGSGEIRVVL